MHLCTLGGNFMRWFSELQVNINRLSANQMAVHQGMWAGWRRLAEVQTAGQHGEPQSSALLCETKHLSHVLAWSDVCWQNYFYTTNCPANRGSLNSPNYGLLAAHYIYHCGAANIDLINTHYPFQDVCVWVEENVVSVQNHSKLFYYPACKN